jgi:hypothetical protein
LNDAQREPPGGGEWNGGKVVASVVREKREEGKREEIRKKGQRGGLSCLSRVDRTGVTRLRHLLWRDWWPRVTWYMGR